MTILSRFHRILERDGRTDRQTDRQNCYTNIARRYPDARWEFSGKSCQNVPRQQWSGIRFDKKLNYYHADWH